MIFLIITLVVAVIVNIVFFFFMVLYAMGIKKRLKEKVILFNDLEDKELLKFPVKMTCQYEDILYAVQLIDFHQSLRTEFPFIVYPFNDRNYQKLYHNFVDVLALTKEMYNNPYVPEYEKANPIMTIDELSSIVNNLHKDITQ